MTRERPTPAEIEHQIRETEDHAADSLGGMTFGTPWRNRVWSQVRRDLRDWILVRRAARAEAAKGGGT